MCSRTLNNRFSVSLEQFWDLSHSSQHKSDHVSNLLKTSQCLPLMCGIKSFKDHHELALPPSWPHLPGAPVSCHSGCPSHSDLLIVPGQAMGTPIPSSWICPSFPLAGTLSWRMFGWFRRSLNSVLCSNAILWERPFLNIVSQTPPYAHTPSLLTVSFSSQPLSLLKNMHLVVICFFMICPPF